MAARSISGTIVAIYTRRIQCCASEVVASHSLHPTGEKCDGNPNGTESIGEASTQFMQNLIVAKPRF